MIKTISLLLISNLFMTFAWYGHLKEHKSSPLHWVILVAWGIAFFEYCFQVPANRIGSQYFTLGQLKVMQEVITMAVFATFAVLYILKPNEVSAAGGAEQASARGFKELSYLNFKPELLF